MRQSWSRPYSAVAVDHHNESRGPAGRSGETDVRYVGDLVFMDAGHGAPGGLDLFALMQMRHVSCVERGPGTAARNSVAAAFVGAVPPDRCGLLAFPILSMRPGRCRAVRRLRRSRSPV